MSPTIPRRPASFTLPPFPQALRKVVERLPVMPPSMVLAKALNRVWWPMLDDAARQGLIGRVVEIVVDDVGLTCRLVADQGGLRAAQSSQPTAVRLRAQAVIYWRLFKAVEDPDTLFFERSLMMEGDTEFGLFLKNTLDAVGPVELWRRRAAR
ncbi:MAG: SCP2 sterol-binding domain-containing protein [Burkholderiales bacterium]|nr:SCP2 sterol-binding domain-containing protein [Burkholderiales bacterium]